MAIILRGMSECPLCGEVIGERDRIVATSHFIADQDDLLWRFSDAAMHYDCFQVWEQRSTFVQKYRETHGSMTAGNGTCHDMQDDGTILVRDRATGKEVGAS